MVISRGNSRRCRCPTTSLEPPDLVLVEVLEALPGRPISGERLVRPDGKISLGFYGDVYVAGLTMPEVKEKIVLHLRKYLTDEILGLVEAGRDGRDRRPTTKTRKPKMIDPKDSRQGLRRRHGLQQQELLRLGRCSDHWQAADHGQRNRARRDPIRRRLDAHGRAPEYSSGSPGSSRRLLRTGLAGQPLRHHQRGRSHDQLSAHAERPNHRLSRPDRPPYRLPRSAGCTVPDRRRARSCNTASRPGTCRSSRPPSAALRERRRRGPITNLPLEPGAR